MLIPRAPLGLITTSVQALAGVLLPSATVFLLLLCNDKEVLGPWVNRPWLNVLAGFIVAVLLALSLILMATTVFPNLNVDTLALVLGGIIVARIPRPRRLDAAARPAREAPCAPGAPESRRASRRGEVRRETWRMPQLALLAAPGLVARAAHRRCGPSASTCRGRRAPADREGRADRDRALTRLVSIAHFAPGRRVTSRPWT